MAVNNQKNYYELLGVNADADTVQIKAAYRKLARKFHPDINKSQEAVEIFKQITQAHEILTNTQKREQYNIINGIFKTQHKQEEPKNSTKPEQKQTRQSKTYTYKKTPAPKLSFFRVLKYWSAKFKKKKREKENKKPQKGQNITTDITITPAEVITGSKRIINVLTTQTCTNCLGHKFINGGKCPVCTGSGEVSKRKRITVTIPKGIKDGAKLRLKGEGASGQNGGANGDLYINIKIETPAKIHFDKLNIYYNIPITPYEAALGEEIKITTFDGVIKLKLPKNTCSGQKFRIAGQGIKKNNKAGDLIVTVNIEFSHDLSDDEIKLYQKLKNLSNDDVRKNFINENCN